MQVPLQAPPSAWIVAHRFDLLRKLMLLHACYLALPCLHLVNSVAVLFQPVIGLMCRTTCRVTTATVRDRPPVLSPSIGHVAVKPLLVRYVDRLVQPDLSDLRCRDAMSSKVRLIDLIELKVFRITWMQASKTRRSEFMPPSRLMPA
jgi:hypothetical protein